jgi:hypothetical protein
MNSFHFVLSKDEEQLIPSLEYLMCMKTFENTTHFYSCSSEIDQICPFNLILFWFLDPTVTWFLNPPNYLLFPLKFKSYPKMDLNSGNYKKIV